MTSSVNEIFTESCCFNNCSCRAVDVFACRTNDTGSNTGSLRSKQHFIGLRNIACRLARVHATGDVAAITIHCSAKVAQHNFILGNHTRACMVVRACGIFSRGNDGKVNDVVPFGKQSRRNISRHLGFGAANERYLARMQLLSNSVCSGTGSLQCSNLTCIF